MHVVEAKGILSANNGMNLYRGCTHGCIYCDSRSDCYQMRHAFDDIEVKGNAISLLEQALKRKRKPCMIGTGSMTDPYIPLELQLGHMRQALELIQRYGCGVTIHTKSDRVLRDLDLLQAIQENSKCVVQMTLTTYDEDLCKIIEPNVATTRERFETLCKLRDAGIPTVVWLCPILPFINDTVENLLGILEYCKAAGVRYIVCFGMGLTLRDGNRSYFYQQLDRFFPGMKERYIQSYGNAYEVVSPRAPQLMQVFTDFCRRYDICYQIDEIFAYLRAYEQKDTQLSLF